MQDSHRGRFRKIDIPLNMYNSPMLARYLPFFPFFTDSSAYIYATFLDIYFSFDFSSTYLHPYPVLISIYERSVVWGYIITR